MAMVLSMRRMRIAISGAALIAGIGAADAACNASFGIENPSPVVFNPFDGVLAFQEFHVTVRNGGSDACTFAVAVKSDATGSERKLRNGADELTYVIKTDGGVQLTNDLQAPAGILQVDGGTEAAITLRIEVPAGQISRAGSFFDNITVRLFDITGAATQVGADQTSMINGFVPARAQINLAGGDTAFGAFQLDHLDFGELEEGETRDAAVQVRSTAPVTVTILSQNAGVLRHKVLGSSVLAVPYELSLAGISGDLSVGPFSVDRTPAITLAGESYPLHITVGSLAGRVAGQYQDILTISVSPR